MCALAIWLIGGMAPSAEMPDLSGTWVFNPDLSDSPRQKLEAGDRAQPRAPRAGSPGDHERARIRDEIRRALDGPARMTVEQNGDRVIVTADDGATHTFEADNRPHRSIAGSGLQIERRTRWDNGTLVSDVTLPQGAYTQTWGRNGPLLIVTTRFSRGRGGTPVVSRRVYEREAK
jgi:hypothetical protein